MSEELIELEEEEYTSPLTAPIFRRIVGLMRPHWRWVVGFHHVHRNHQRLF